MIRSNFQSVLAHNEDVLASLDKSQQEEIAAILENYLTDLEAGKATDRASVLRRHPQLAHVLSTYMESVQKLYQAGVAAAPEAGGNDANAPSTDRTVPNWPEDDLPGAPTRLGDYRIKHEIGRGGMGIVYAAEQISLGRPVALKTLPFAAVLNQTQVARFKNEAQAAASLHHPNIVPVYGVGCERGVHYFSMQLIEGQSLEEAIAQLRDQSDPAATVGAPAHETDAVSPNRTTAVNHFSCTIKSIRHRDFARSVARIGQQAAQALHYAHENGVIHRDIKPSNLLLDSEGKLWITDFGLARVVDASNLTVSGDMLGTARYMSPEQAGGRQHEVDYRSDIYSLGITLYELLTLQPAFQAATRQEIVQRVATETPTRPRKLNPAIPMDLETVVLKAIERRRDDRYHSAAELAEDLENFVEGRAPRAKRPGIHDRAMRWAAQHRSVVAAGIALLILVQVGIGVTTWLLSSERNRTEAEATRAVAYLRETQRVVDDFGALVDRRLEHLPGSSSLRAELLGKLENYYSAFLDEAGQSPTLLVDLAQTRFRLAAVHQRLGDFDRAAIGYQQALAGFENLLRQSPGDVERSTDIALCRNNLGQVAAARGDYARARQEYESAIRLYEQVRQRSPKDASRGIGRTRMNLGLLLTAERHPAAMPVLEQALDGLLELAGEAPQDQELQDQLALCENNLASVVMKSDLPRAESLLRSAVARYETLSTGRPASPEHRSDQALALGNLAAILAREGQQERASELIEQVIDLRMALVDLEPQVNALRYDLAVAQQQLGQMLVASRQNEQALRAYKEAQKTLRGLLQHNPNNHQTVSGLGRTLSNAALLEASNHNYENAGKLLDEAIEYQQRAIELSPGDSSYRELLSHLHQQRAGLPSATKQDAVNRQPSSTLDKSK